MHGCVCMFVGVSLAGLQVGVDVHAEEASYIQQTIQGHPTHANTHAQTLASSVIVRAQKQACPYKFPRLHTWSESLTYIVRIAYIHCPNL
jgi:hypothetical protein